MAMPRYIKWPLWFLLAIIVIIGLSALLLMTEIVQTSLANHFLEDFNKSLKGKIEFASVHAALNGEIILTELSIKDSLDQEIVGLSKLRATLEPWGLLDNRVHLLRLKLTGLRTRIEMDSTGNNISAVFASDSVASDSIPTSESNWEIIADRIEIEGERTTFTLDQQALLDLDSWTFNASGSYVCNLITYEIKLRADQGISLDSKGEINLTDDLPAMQAKLTAALDSVITSHFPDPVFKLGTIQLSATTSFEDDSLNAEFDFTSSTVGRLSGKTALRDPSGFFYGKGELAFEHLNSAPLMEDSVSSDLNGSLTFKRSQAEDYVNGWDAKLALLNSTFMNERLTTDLAVRTEDSTAWINGSVETLFGGALLDLVIGGFDPEKMSAAGELSISNVKLHHFAPDIPDSLSPLSGLIQLDFPSVNPDSLVGQSYIRLNKLQFGRHRLDSAVVYADIDRQKFEIDTLKLQLDDIRVDGSLNGVLGDNIEFNISGVIPELADIGELLRTLEIELDSIAGFVDWDLAGHASLAGDSLSGLTVHGDVRLGDCRYADYSVDRAGVRITDYQLDNNSFSGALGAYGIHLNDQIIDSVTVVAHGNLEEISTTADLWALGDTLQLSATFDTRIEPEQISISLEQLTATTFGAEWKTAFPSDIYLIDDRIEIDGIQFSSAYGVLRAIGYLQAEGDQDLTLELSGFQTEKLAKLLELDLPSANVNIRLQVTGTDTALTGDIAVSVDSMLYNGNLISDELYLFANILRDKIEIDGYSTWYADTLTTFGGSLPARLSFSDGFVLSESEPLFGEARIFDQPLERLNPWLAIGTKADGILSADLKVSGTPDNPDWEGFFSVREGLYVDPRIGVNYRYIVLDGKLHGDSLIIDQFRATARGTLSGSGYAIMGLPTPEYLNLNIKFDRFNAQNSPRQKARLSGKTAITGPFDSLDVQGSLKIEELLYRITQATSKDIETIDLEAYLAKLRGDSVVEGGFVLDDLYRGMSHDLRIEIPGNCWMRGGGINIELFGDLSLFKEKNDDPVVNGDINVRRGTIELVGHELKVEQGVVNFSGPIDDPEMDITAISMKIYRREGAEIRARLYGPVSNTRIDFSGRLADGTELTPEEVVRALLLGTTTSGGSFDINQSAASIAAAPISQLIEKKSGLDVFQFRPGEEGINDLSSGSLEVGTYLTDRLFIRVLQPIETIQSGQEVSIEYQLKEWLKLIAEQKGREQSAFDIFVQLEWR